MKQQPEIWGGIYKRNEESGSQLRHHSCSHGGASGPARTVTRTHRLCTCNTAPQVPRENGGAADVMFIRHGDTMGVWGTGVSGQGEWEPLRHGARCACLLPVGVGTGGPGEGSTGAGGGGRSYFPDHLFVVILMMWGILYFSKYMYSLFYDF